MKSIYISNTIIVLMLASLMMIAIPMQSSEVSTIINGAIYRGNSDRQVVSIMVNVYWGTEYIQPMLDVMADYDVECTFFVGGSWAIDNVDILSDIYESGHEIGNHAYTHTDMDTIDADRQAEEITITHNIVKLYTGADMVLFAPPSGAYNDTTISVSAALGYSTVLWSHDTIDWRDEDAGLVYSRATSDDISGGLILMHPTAHTLQALPDIIEYYIDNGYTIESVSNNIG